MHKMPEVMIAAVEKGVKDYPKQPLQLGREAFDIDDEASIVDLGRVFQSSDHSVVGGLVDQVFDEIKHQ